MVVRASSKNGGMASGILQATARAVLAALLLAAAVAAGVFFLLR